MKLGKKIALGILIAALVIGGLFAAVIFGYRAGAGSTEPKPTELAMPGCKLGDAIIAEGTLVTIAGVEKRCVANEDGTFTFKPENGDETKTDKTGTDITATGTQTTPLETGNVVWYNACTSDALSEDVSALKNNGQVVPNAYSFLDRNEAEVAMPNQTGYWHIEIPANVYGHIFFPVSGLTYQVRGPGRVVVGAATFWCDNGGSTPHNAQYQMVDAKRLDEMLLDSNWELTGDGAIGAWVKIPDPANQPK